MNKISDTATNDAFAEEVAHLVFSYEDAQQRFNHDLIKIVVLPIVMVIYGVFAIYATDSIEAFALVRSAIQWIGFTAIACGLLGVAIFSGKLKSDYKDMKKIIAELATRGLHA